MKTGVAISLNIKEKLLFCARQWFEGSQISVGCRLQG